MIVPAQWKPVGVGALEHGARVAITSLSESTVVSANPGSGKTELLAQRADFLFRTGACRYPSKILAISFKTDAARTLSKRVRDRSGITYAHRMDSLTFHAFARRIIAIYRPLLKGNQRLDPCFKVGQDRIGTAQVAYKELLPMAQRLINSHPMVKRSVILAYSHVFLDEFQDCTTEQYELIASLFRDTEIPITGVGDAKQMIMGWAGALDGVMQKFAEEFGAVKLSLIQNWRSAPAIRRVQNRMISVMEPASAIAESELTGDGGQVFLARFKDEETEARRIADKIQTWIDEGIPAHEIAILHIRQTALFNQPISAALDRLGIPYRNEQDLQDLCAEPLSELVVNVLLVLGERPSPEAYAATLYTLTASSDEDRGNWVRALHQARRIVTTTPADQRAHVAFEHLRRIMSAVERSVLLSLSSDYDGARVDEVLNNVYASIGGLIDQHCDLDKALARYRDEGSVRVMTIHKCKGMEFKCVILPCTERETWWGSEDENRRSYFVGISRAKEKLVVTYADRRSPPAKANSRWVASRRPHEEFLSYVRKDAVKRPAASPTGSSS